MVSLLRRDPEVSREDTDLGTVPLAGRLVEDMTAVADMQVAEGNSAVERSPAEDKRAVEDKCQSRARAQTGAYILAEAVGRNLAEAVPDKE
jgi:hypothetical protein